jgi:hypothetical protein
VSTEPGIRAGHDEAVEADDPLADLSDPDSFEDGPEPYDEPAGDLAAGDGPFTDDPYLRAERDFGDSDPVLLVWPRQEFEEIDQRWPEVLEPIGTDSWDDYRLHYQGLITRWTSRGLPLSMVVGTADGFAEWLVEQGADPVSVDLAAMADAYGGYLTEQAGVVELPPAPDDPCWCGSGLGYQGCCQPLVHTETGGAADPVTT